MKSFLNYSLILLALILTNSQAGIANFEPVESTALSEEANLLNYKVLNYKELEGLIYIDEQNLYDRYQNAKPVYRNEKTGILHYVKDEVDLQRLRNYSFIWDPILSAPIAKHEKILTIETYHAYASYPLFKPSIDEVLAQIPSQLLGQKIFFEIVLPGDGQLRYQKYIHLGFHCAKAIFYRLKD